MIGGVLRVDSGASEEGFDADIIYVWEAARCSSLNVVGRKRCCFREIKQAF
jgi:hypothetical protein